MTPNRIFSFIFALLFSLPCFVAAQSDDSRPKRIRGVQYEVEGDSATLAMKKTKTPVFAGVSVSTDMAGLIMANIARYGSYEAACRVSIKDRYFPIVEVGVGTSNHTDGTTDINYKTHSPFFRFGLDYNFTKDRMAFGRLTGGVRYAFSSFRFDISGPTFEDAVWNDPMPFNVDGLKSRAHWCEFVFGIDAKVWKFIRLGWNLRYKFLFSQKKSAVGKAWYIPGYGENKGSSISGQFNLIFEI